MFRKIFSHSWHTCAALWSATVVFKRALEKKQLMIFIYCDINQCHNKALLVQACLTDHTAFVSINQHVSYFFLIWLHILQHFLIKCSYDILLAPSCWDKLCAVTTGKLINPPRLIIQMSTSLSLMFNWCWVLLCVMVTRHDFGDAGADRLIVHVRAVSGSADPTLGTDRLPK